jgi:hypothetical protein
LGLSPCDAIVIWSGNIPAEVVWYLQRESAVWGIAFRSLIGFQVVAPFFALLTEKVRQQRRPLLAIAAITLMLRILEACVLALPGRPYPAWASALGLAGATMMLGGVWWITFLAVLKRVETELPPSSF